MTKTLDPGLAERLLRRLEETALALEKSHITEYLEFMHNPWRIISVNFLAGVTRGFGLAVGFTAVGALFLYILGRIAALNLPIVGEFLAEIARIVQHELAQRP